MPEPKTKTINGVAFLISQPYEAGQTIGEAEARALNQVRSENIGNNVRAKLKELQDAGADQAQLEAVVSERDAEYVLTVGNVGEGRKLDPIEREADKIAREIIKGKLAETGRKLTVPPTQEGYNTDAEGNTWTEDSWKAYVQTHVDALAVTDPIVKAAKKRVDARKKQADELAGALEGTAL